MNLLVADIPGLMISNKHVGLGHEFLGHVDRSHNFCNIYYRYHLLQIFIMTTKLLQMN